ncbi:hypothetical protein GCM10010440_77890 [Kitasatospora cinereorecta]
MLVALGTKLRVGVTGAKRFRVFPGQTGVTSGIDLALWGNPPDLSVISKIEHCPEMAAVTVSAL